MFACNSVRFSQMKTSPKAARVLGYSPVKWVFLVAVIGIFGNMEQMLSTSSSTSSSIFVHANDNSTNATDNSTTTSTAAPEALCVNVTTPTNVTTTVTNTTDNTTSEVIALQNVTECVACEEVTTLQNVTTTSVNATDNSTISTTALQNVTECVPITVDDSTTTTSTTTVSSTTSTTTVDPSTLTKILGSLDLTFAVPEGVTASSLNSNVNFKAALAKSIKGALGLGATADVVIKEIKAAAVRSILLRQLASESLKLVVEYEITLPKTEAEAVYTKIADSSTFQDAVKAQSVTELASAGFTGYKIDSVKAEIARGDMAPPTTTEAPSTSGAFSLKNSPNGLATTIFLVGSIFSLKLGSF